ncbi:MAG: DUF4922 domain-containing protein [Bacteroidales bacterium]|nr:DUF4922 domain-containing protein [Bacteroidales bacterium]
MSELSKFIQDQLSVWPLAAANFRALRNTQTRSLTVGGLQVSLQFNPCRIASSTAETDEATLAARKCFLCSANRPKEQFHVKFEGRKHRRYNIQVNPYPIFPAHLVIAREEHVPQAIWHHLPDMLDFAWRYREYTVYYNGPYSGASAPDHLHFQACPRGLLPLENAASAFLDNPPAPLATVQDARLYHYTGYTTGIYALRADTTKSLAKLFYQFLDCCPERDGGLEPRFNLYAWFERGEYRAMVVLRTEIRSHHYYAQGPEHLTISPGAAEMAGVFVAPIREDFDKADAPALEEMLREVSVSAEDERMIAWRLTRRQPVIEVGILSAATIRFEIISDGAGPQQVSYCGGRINYNGALYDELVFDAITRSTLFAEPSFILYDVTIGQDFHWERKQDQKFAGQLKFIAEQGRITAVNKVGLEDYLLSVVSSEMRASASPEFLKAHAVISRSWAVRRIRERQAGAEGIPHASYDVCADDHCQRYQGLTPAIGAGVRQAIDETWGELLCYRGEICDTRYAKCCGGRTELFSTCWEERDYPYLQSVEDPYCDCHDKDVLAQVLNDYDLETQDFHDWQLRYSAAELSAIIRERSGLDFGEIRALEPLGRGPSGRIKALRIVGSKRTETIGKELAIRRILSPSHLKSSAFRVSREGGDFVLEGHGWGHGVGLCQIGAAVMATQGRTYKEILQYYDHGAGIE